jgi:ParB family chromosome partitioning protein
VEGMKVRKISLDDVDLKDERFRFSYHFDLDRFLLSIKKIGLANPLVVTIRNQRLVLVTGWKRLFACKELSFSPLPVFVLEQDDDLRAFLFSLYENLTHRDFDLLEKAEILQKLNRFIHDERQIVKEYLPLLRIPATLSYLDLYVNISRLEPRWKRVIYDKKMSLPCVSLLMKFDAAERDLLLPLILPVGQNKQRQILEDLIQLSKKEEKSPQDILSSQRFRPTLQSEKLSPPQKAEQMRRLLSKESHPFLSALKESFDASLKKARLSKEVKIESSSFFEDGEFLVSFNLRNEQDFHERLVKLQKLVSDKDFPSLFKRTPDA